MNTGCIYPCRPFLPLQKGLPLGNRLLLKGNSPDVNRSDQISTSADRRFIAALAFVRLNYVSMLELDIIYMTHTFPIISFDFLLCPAVLKKVNQELGARKSVKCLTR